MKKNKSKLLNNHGVSILFALLLFLVVSMVSVTIIAASTSSVKRTSSMKENTQTILTLDSAVLLLKSELNNLTYTVNVYDGSTFSDELYNGKETCLKDIVSDISKKLISSSNSSNDNYKTFVIKTNIDEIKDVDVLVSYEFNSANSSNVVKFILTLDNSAIYVDFNLTDSVTGTFGAITSGTQYKAHKVEWSYGKASYK